MAKASSSTPGGDLAEQFYQALHDLQHAPLPGARDLPMLGGVNLRGGFLDPHENVICEAIRLLKDSAKVFTYGNSVAMEIHRLDGRGMGLTPLRLGSAITTGAEDFIDNIFACCVDDIEFPPPKWFVDVLLRSNPLARQLPRVKQYATRAVFDSHFILRGPGWHSDDGILVHGADIEPISYSPQLVGTVLQRLPFHLRTLLGGFCFQADADVVNTVAMMLTGLLIGQFIQPGKPMMLVDGNQPDVGKTWLVRAIGVALDGLETPPVSYTPDDEELQKRVGAKLMERTCSVLLIDNAKRSAGSAVSSPFLESMTTSAEISIRILGRSANYTRPNDLIVAITMNDTKVSRDLALRAVPIRLQYEGATQNRIFAGPDPITYARAHQLDILGELAGIISYWLQQGRQSGSRNHRFHHWASVIGGILETAGFPEFLENAEAAAAEFNAGADAFQALVEALILENGPIIYIHPEDEEESI